MTLVEAWGLAHEVALERHGPDRAYQYTTGPAGRALLDALEQARDDASVAAIIDHFIPDPQSPREPIPS